jgi:tetratricopeptide (TPR) repeat protein
MKAQDSTGDVESLISEGHYKQALTEMNKHIHQNDEVPELLLTRAQIYQHMGSIPEAQRDYEKALQLEPRYSEAHYLLAQLHLEEGSYERAIHHLDILLDEKTISTRAIFLRTDPYGERSQAFSSLYQMNSKIWSDRGRACHALGWFDEARHSYRQSLVYGDSTDVFINLALLYSAWDKKDSAVFALQKAIANEPNSSLAWYNWFLLDPQLNVPAGVIDSTFAPMLSLKATEAFSAGDLETAASLMDKAMSLSEYESVLWLNAARLDLKKEEPWAALEKLQTVLLNDPQYVEVLYLLGAAYYGMKDFDSAIRFYEKYLRRDPFNGMVWLNKGIVYLQKAEVEKACDAFQKAYELGREDAMPYRKRYCEQE